MLEKFVIEEQNGRGVTSWRRLGLLLLEPIWFLCVLVLAIGALVLLVPVVGPLVLLLLLPLACLAYWILLVCAGLSASARDTKTLIEGDIITLSVITDPLKFPSQREVYRFNWSDVSSVEGVFDSPLQATLIALTTGERFKDGLATDWSSLREEAERRGLFDNSGRHVSFDGVVVI